MSAASEPTFWTAADLARAGYPVFPVGPSKAPSVKGGFYAATTEYDQVGAWINEGRERHDVAFATGIPSGVVVIDADTAEAYARMEGQYGPPQVRTYRGGHWYFRHPKNGKVSSVPLGEGLDRKGDGGYVVAPPSGGRVWTAGIPDRKDLPLLPQELRTERAAKVREDEERILDAKQHRRAVEAVSQRVSGIEAGKRHEHLKHLCGVLLARDVAFEDARSILEGAWTKAGGDLAARAAREVPNTLRTTEEALVEGRATGVPSLEKITPGLYEELEEIFGWKVRISFGGRGPGGHELNANGHTGPPGILLSEVIPERVRWLWEGRIALGKLNLVDGDPGTGKSAATTDLAARVSVGKPWPDGSECEAGGVVILSAEDGLADTIRPRFDAAGGDPSRAVAVSTVPDAEGNERQIAIPDDLRVIEKAIERVGAVLVVIDPLMAFLPGEVNSHRDQDVRRALAPLARLAERTGAAVVVVRHLNKGIGGNALYRGGGSIGIVGAARSGLLIAKHPEEDGRRVLASIKSNLAPPAPSLVFGLSATESGAVRVDWKGESNLDAAALLSAPTDHEERSALFEAQEFLREILADGSRPTRDVEDEGREAGIEPRTLKRAKQKLGVISERQGGIGERGKWYWRLPAGASLAKRTSPEDGPLSSSADRTDASIPAHVAQEQRVALRGPSTGGVNGANGHGPLSEPLSAILRPGQSASLAELRSRREAGLSSADVRQLFARPPRWLQDQAAHCRRQGTPENQVEALAAAVASELSGDPTRGREVLAAVEAQFHEIGCGCEECL